MNYLITGLGNPGKSYEETRHNIGFRVLKAFAAAHMILLRPSLVRAKGTLGQGKIGEQTVFLLLPLTYMNESGRAVRKCIDYYKVLPSHLLVVADDVDLPFETLRMRGKGGSGGHNGLKSIEAHLGTQDYPRLRIGVGGRSSSDLADYVLDRFTAEEESHLPEVVDRAVQGIELWLAEGLEMAMQKLNRLGEK